MTVTEEQAVTQSRRRFARRQWARRWLAWKYVVALVALLGLVVGAVWLVLFSSWLSVRGVEIQGLHQLRPDQVRAAAAVPEGTSLARVDLDRIRTRVEALAPVRSADVSRKWPDKVLIRVTERTAVAVVEIAGRWRGMDSDGVVFQSYARPPAGMPRVESTADTDSDALREAARVVGALPSDLAAKVDHVEVRTVDEISLALRDGRTVTWGSSEDSDLKARVLAAMLQLPARHFDVSVPGQATTGGPVPAG